MRIACSAWIAVASLASCEGRLSPHGSGVRSMFGLPPAAVLQEDQQRRELSVITPGAKFAPLSCNDSVSACESLKDALGDARTFTAEYVVPCGACLSAGDFVGGEVLDFQGGLRIDGRLDLPEGTKVTIRAPHVFVQGELSAATAASSVVNGEGSVRIEMTGDADVTFVPSEDASGGAAAAAANQANAAACPGGCDVGKRPVVVAGGVLNLSGLPESCAAWTRPLTPPAVIADPADSTIRSDVLPVPVQSDFLNGLDGWYGNMGARELLVNDTNVHDSPYLEISKRKETWQGPMIELSKEVRSKMAPDEKYYWSARVMIKKENGTSDCVSGADPAKCPELALLRMDSENRIAWFPLSDPNPMDSDGEFYDLAGEFSFNELQMNPQDVFAILTLKGPEANVTISMESFTLEHGSNKLLADDSGVNPCASLVPNGDAEDSTTRTYPMKSLLKNDPLTIKKDPNTGNQYFHLATRSYFYSTLTFDVRPACAVPDSEYRFSMKVRSHAAEEIQPRVIMKIYQAGDNFKFETLAVCEPTSSANPDFVSCEGVVTFTAEHVDAERLQVLVITSQNENTDPMDYDDVSFFTPQGVQLFEDPADSACWGADASVLLTSLDGAFDGDRLTTVTVSRGGAVDFAAADGNSTGTKVPLSKTEDADFASEVAMLSRNIVLEGKGGHVLVLPSTSTKPHKIDGVELRGFGQAGVKDRYPINFHMAGDQTGTVVSRNSIVDSEHRCVNLNGVSKVQVTDNICYNSKGHGFVLETGSEQDNTFSGNLGARTNPAEVAVAGMESEASTPATFFISNPQNTFTGNVAAGSEAYGFWLDLKSAVTGDDAAAFPDVHPDRLPLKDFSNNMAHSNDVGVTTFPTTYVPTELAVFRGSTVHKNRSKGVVLHKGSNVAVEEGIVANNLVGIDAAGVDSVRIANLRVEGYTGDAAAHCVGATTPLIGVRIGNGAESVLDGVHFKKIDSDASGCSAGAAATDLLEETAGATYSGTTHFKDVRYDDTVTASKYSICDAVSKDVKSLIIADEEGNLNPEGRNPGYLVPDSLDTTGLYEVCLDMDDGSCSKYCLGSTTAPRPVTTTASPVSSPGVSPTTECTEQIVRNGGFDDGMEEWFFIGPTTGIKLVDGVTGSGLATKQRDQWYFGMAQTVDKNCLHEGAKYEVSMDVRITKNGAPATCEPFNQFFDFESACPTLAMRLDDVETRDMAKPVGPWDSTGGWNKVYGIFTVTADLLATSKLEMYVSKAAAGKNVEIDNVSVKPVSATTFGLPTCTELILNGDAEIGDARFWHIKGDGDFGTIEMISPGATGQHAFAHTGNRAKIWNGVRQQLEQDCMAVGSNWKITFKMKLFDASGNAAECDKSLQYGDNVCPMVYVQSFSRDTGTHQTLPLRNASAGGWIVGGWNDYEATFTMTSEHKAKDTTQWFVHNVKPGYTYHIDDVSMVPA